MNGYHAIMTESDEARWRVVRKGIAPAYSMNAIRWGEIRREWGQNLRGRAEGMGECPPPWGATGRAGFHQHTA